MTVKMQKKFLPTDNAIELHEKFHSLNKGIQDP